MLVNLAADARDAMAGRSGALTLSAPAVEVGPGGAAPAGRHVRQEEADTGPGMPPEVLARAAEPFFTTKPAGRGTGLGLAMAKGFAEQSGGGFSLASRPGEGVVATLWLPAAAAAPAQEPPAAAPAQELPEGAPGRVVLLVDDDALVREVTAEGLRDAGWGVVAAGGGAEALALLDGGAAFDALLTDLSMPGMSGVAVIHEARRRRSCSPATRRRPARSPSGGVRAGPRAGRAGGAGLPPCRLGRGAALTQKAPGDRSPGADGFDGAGRRYSWFRWPMKESSS